jgi:hypothetical protein
VPIDTFNNKPFKSDFLSVKKLFVLKPVNQNISTTMGRQIVLNSVMIKSAG